MARSEKREASKVASSLEPVYIIRYEIFFPVSLAASMARQIGAIFMKLGRAPDTMVTFIVYKVKNDETKIRILREIIRYFADKIDRCQS